MRTLRCLARLHLAWSLWRVDDDIESERAQLGVSVQSQRLPCAGGISGMIADTQAARCPQDVMDAVVQAYVVHLMEAGRHALVPQYACHLRAGLRHLTYQVSYGTPLQPPRWVWSHRSGEQARHPFVSVFVITPRHAPIACQSLDGEALIGRKGIILKDAASGTPTMLVILAYTAVVKRDVYKSQLLYTACRFAVPPCGRIR